MSSSRCNDFGIYALILIGWGLVTRSIDAQQTAERADSLFTLAKAYYDAGHPDSALKHYYAVASIDRALGDKEGEGNTLYNIGIIYAETGFPDSALAAYRSALAIHTLRGVRGDQAKVLSVIGEIFSTIGNPDSAFRYYGLAVSMRRAIRDVEGESETTNNIGNLYRQLGRFDTAMVFYRSALVMVRQIGSARLEPQVLSNIGTTLLELRRPDSAPAFYHRALFLARLNGDVRTEAAVLQALGNLFYMTGPPDSALHYYRAGMRFHYALGDREATARAFNNMGQLFTQLDHADSALFYYRVALPLWRQARSRTSEANTLVNIGYLLAVAGTAKDHFVRAAQYYDSAAAIYAGVRARSGADANAVAFAEEQRTTFDDWAHTWLMQASLVSGAERERAVYSALSAAERGRAQALRQLLDAGGTEASRPVAMKNASTRNIVNSDTVPGADLIAEANRLLAPLRQSHTAALHYLFGPDSLTIWLLDPDGSLTVLRSVSLSVDSLTLFVTTLRRGVGADAARRGMTRGANAGDAEQENTGSASRGVEDDAPSAEASLRAAKALSAQLVPAALMRKVPAGAELVIVPQAILGLVPFAALTVPGDTVPLGIRNAIRYAPSLRALNAAEVKPASGASALVVADPGMPIVKDVNGNMVRLRDLPAAKQEGAKVAHLLNAPLLASTDASETAVRRQLPGARFVHLATHGLAFGNEARVRQSYVALAPDIANDGLLTIGELIDEIPALSADLVVLSACQTGLGNLKEAEGTIGFQRAFLAKGVRSVLVSLWSVDDEATALLMERFYSHWLGPNQQRARSKAEALRQAQADVRSTDKYRDPRYWAAFQLVGAN